MRSKPIGVFDSGVGGLSVLNALKEMLPDEYFIYVADQAYTPYGEKSKETITARAVAITNWLVAQDCKLIVVACNTATTNAIAHLRTHFSMPFVGIEPAIKPAALGSQTGVIGVLATAGTLTSTLFQTTSQDYTQGLEVISQVGHGLVALVEKGKEASEATEKQLREILSPMLEKPIDHLVLGCTHYPFLTHTLKKILPEHVTIVDCSTAVAKQTHRLLDLHNLHNSSGGTTTYYSTTSPEFDVWKSFGVEQVSGVKI
ncbi:MAG: glutamate racemase [Flavobacteriaceae bacterium]|nr:glutamate racemase [Flavobacteriaceae bacterium]